MKKMLLTAACLFVTSQASAVTINVNEMVFWDASNPRIYGGYTDPAVTGLVDFTAATGQLNSSVNFFGFPWNAAVMWATETPGAHTWAGTDALPTKTKTGTNYTSFTYNFTLAAGDVAVGFYFDWSTNIDIPVLTVLHPNGDGTWSAVDQAWTSYAGGPLNGTGAGTGMQTAPFPGQWPAFAGVTEITDPCAGVVCDTPGPCQTGGTCVDGNCVYDSTCAPGQSCIGGVCDMCYNVVCDDGDACNGVETCNSASGCVAGTPLNCDDGNLCTNDSCTSGACSNVPVVCGAGESCAPSTGVCTPNDLCIGVICDNGDACDGIETCDPSTGGCINGTPMACDDGNACTVDSCTGGGCVNTPVTCSAGEVCTDGQCVPVEVCDDTNCVAGPCQQAECVNGECVTTFCNEAPGIPGMYCVNDECVPDPCYQVDCPPIGDCMIGECSRALGTAGECVYTGCPEGQFCQDEVCIEPDACANVICDDGYVCTEGQCVPMADHKVDICHKGKLNLSIDASALDAHMAHGDSLGQCETSRNVKK